MSPSSPPPGSPSRVLGPNFFDFPPEIRLKIYSVLLVLSEPFTFVVTSSYGRLGLRLLFRPRGDSLCPALLRVNKKAHSEATPLLYSNNCFRISDMATSAAINSHVAPFFRQIGSQSSLIRNICITFPYLDGQVCEAGLHNGEIEYLRLIRSTCTGITTLSLSFPPDWMLHNLPTEISLPDLLFTSFKAIPSLKKIIVNIDAYDGEDMSDLMCEMRDYGWIVEVTNIGKRLWVSEDDRVEFNNEEDCRRYNDEQCFLEWQREQEREREEWDEEYYRRRNDPYIKNDSDYD